MIRLYFFFLILSAYELCSGSFQEVVLGNAVLRQNDFSQLQGERVAVLSNPTGVFADNLKHIVDVMAQRDDFDLTLILSPEHGFRGQNQAETGDPILYVDSETNLPVVSAYKLGEIELVRVLDKFNITAVVVDMQDVGVRLYTFVWTMYDLMVAAGTYGATETGARFQKFVVLDRPNPLGGEVVRSVVAFVCLLILCLPIIDTFVGLVWLGSEWHKPLAHRLTCLRHICLTTTCPFHLVSFA
jgi:uncharacterized protein YbbC (DUF1343 family)